MQLYNISLIGCLLSIPNGVVNSEVLLPGFLLLTYMCDEGYRFKRTTKSITLSCNNGEMSSKLPPCESELNNIFKHVFWHKLNHNKYIASDWPLILLYTFVSELVLQELEHAYVPLIRNIMNVQNYL